MHRIKDLPVHERPREKFLEGCELSTAELLAILLGTGNGSMNSVALASRLLIRFGGLRGLFTASMDKLMAVDGIGPAKATRLSGAFALGRRYLAEKLKERHVIDSRDDLLDYLAHSMRDEHRECLKLITLNSANGIISMTDHGSGTVNGVHVHPREIVKRALQDNATAVIIVHNHPDGSAEPSEEDLSLTAALADLLAAVGIALHDHIVIGRNETRSFTPAENSEW
jgi:DNA repair protein RadC